MMKSQVDACLLPDGRGEPHLAIGCLLVDDVGAVLAELDRQHAILCTRTHAQVRDLGSLTIAPHDVRS